MNSTHIRHLLEICADLFDHSERFSLSDSVITAAIEKFNILGQRIDLIVDRPMEAGEHSVTWDGSGFASGLYFYRFEAGGSVQSGKMMMVK